MCSARLSRSHFVNLIWNPCIIDLEEKVVLCILINFMVDKYKDHLHKARRDRSRQSSPSNLSNGATSIDQSQLSSYDQSKPATHDRTWPRTHHQSRPSSSASLQNGTSWNHLPQSSSNQEVAPKAGYFKDPSKGHDPDIHVTSRPDLVPASSKLLLTLHSQEWLDRFYSV